MFFVNERAYSPERLGKELREGSTLLILFYFFTAILYASETKTDFGSSAPHLNSHHLNSDKHQK